jgi:hypothetical protein
MPSQVGEITDTGYYLLAALDDACGLSFNDLVATAATDSPGFAEMIEPDWLERALRIDFGP